MNERIKLIRINSGLKQDEFAESIGLTRNFISLVENGARVPSDRTIKDICREYRIDENWLRTGEGEMLAVKDREQEIADIVAQMFNGDESDYRYQLQKLISDCDDQIIEALFNFSKNWVDNVNKSKEKELPED